MKICFFTENYVEGGLDTFICNLLSNWPSEEDEIHFFCNKSHRGLNKLKERLANRVVFKEYYAFEFKSNNLFNKFFNIFKRTIIFIKKIYDIRLVLIAENYEHLMVINGGYPGGIYCRSALIAWAISNKKNKAILNIHNLAVPIKWYTFLYEFFVDYLIIKASGKIVTVSKACSNSLRKRPAFDNLKIITHIYNGIAEFKLEIHDRSIQVKSSSMYCLMLAAYLPNKGHDFLLKAFTPLVEKFPDLKLIIAGDDINGGKVRVQESVNRLNISSSVMLYDFVPNPQELLSKALMLVVPSQSYESFGLTIVEAMSLGVPVVATDVGGIPEVLEGGQAGFVSPKHDVTKFSECMAKIIENPQLRMSMSAAGQKEFFNRFTAERMVGEYFDLIKRS